MTSTIKVDNIQKTSDGSNIIKKCGSTITLGSSGQTVAVACGATTSGMGRTGTVDWCTTAKTSPLSAANGVGYFLNTTGGAITVTLPGSPSAGDIVAFKDYANTWNTNAVTLANNGNNINGTCGNSTLNTQDQSVTLVFVDATKGWRPVADSTSCISGEGFIVATGGTITTSGDFKIHTFTSTGSFCVSSGGGPVALVDYMILGGAGGGGANHGGGGGAGGFRESKNPSYAPSWTSSPLVSTTSLGPIGIGAFPVTVGAGGTKGVQPNGNATQGADSVFSTITSAGGGKGSVQSGSRTNMDGGSGGGGTYNNSSCGPSLNTAGSGNTPPVSPPQGNPGGNGIPYPPGASGGGGGASEAGVAGVPGAAGRGGAGVDTSITASPVDYAGGGGGAATSYGVSQGAGSPCGTGGSGSSGPGDAGDDGTTNKGGGGGGGYAAPGQPGGNGGSGVVILRYKFQ